ncbi:glycosyltransferase family 4 protein [Alteromonas facilis]|uniref:glycosyltransferase family 4 protein n=1 Tax=Alteromonas facilis TaxID=2048004 RepID=UPI000C284843|nr:glycosyltransferase family 4 protein [Alteromonas facilis]
MKKPICLVSFDYPPLEGGISRLCAAIVERLVAQEHPVSVVSREHAEATSAFVIPHTNEYRVPAKRGKAEWQLFKRLRRYHRDDLIITGVWYPEALIARLAGCKNIVVLAHGNEVMAGRPTWKNRLLSTARRWLFDHVRLIIANSHYTGELVSAQTQTPVEVATLGVDEKRFVPLEPEQRQQARQRFKLPQDKFVVLTTSRVQAYKGHDVVLKALAEIPEDERTSLHYAIAGRGEHLANLQQLTEELGLTSQVSFLGFVEENDLASLYGCVDVFAMCTREEKENKQVEGFGLVFLEAQACGTPAIGVKQGGITDAIVDQRGGYLIERDDQFALADILRLLVQEPSILAKQQTLARERVEAEATWDHYGQRVSEILARYVEEHHANA